MENKLQEHLKLGMKDNSNLSLQFVILMIKKQSKELEKKDKKNWKKELRVLKKKRKKLSQELKRKLNLLRHQLKEKTKARMLNLKVVL